MADHLRSRLPINHVPVRETHSGKVMAMRTASNTHRLTRKAGTRNTYLCLEHPGKSRLDPGRISRLFPPPNKRSFYQPINRPPSI